MTTASEKLDGSETVNMATRYIIRNATVVSVDTTIGVRSNCDVLIEDSLIKSVGKGLSVDDSTQVIDGTDCTVSPGFVDTHRHMWQTQLAGLLSNHTLVGPPHCTNHSVLTVTHRANTSHIYEASTEAVIAHAMHTSVIMSGRCNV